jgi:outer membrane biosynthesis protein TonB
MKGMLAIRAAVLVLMASQLSNCAWVAAWKSKWQTEPQATPPPKPEPKPEPKPGPTSPDDLPEPQPDPDPSPAPDPEPQPEPKPQPPPPKQNVPVARAVPGKPGYVFSPSNNKLIDVEGIPSGRLVADPHFPNEKRYFRVP